MDDLDSWQRCNPSSAVRRCWLVINVAIARLVVVDIALSADTVKIDSSNVDTNEACFGLLREFSM